MLSELAHIHRPLTSPQQGRSPVLVLSAFLTSFAKFGAGDDGEAAGEAAGETAVPFAAAIASATVAADGTRALLRVPKSLKVWDTA